MLATVHYPPQPVDIDYSRKSLFLAGSIDLGKAVDWQQEVIDGLSHCDIQIFNPRRPDFNWNSVPNTSNPDFVEQVEWELEQLGKADYICYYFDPAGQSPITLLELGLFADHRRCFVCCPEGYWRRGNVEITCKWFSIPFFNTLPEMISELQYKFF